MKKGPKKGTRQQCQTCGLRGHNKASCHVGPDRAADVHDEKACELVYDRDMPDARRSVAQHLRETDGVVLRQARATLRHAWPLRHYPDPAVRSVARDSIKRAVKSIRVFK